VKSIREELEQNKTQRDQKRLALEDQKKRLKKEELQLEAERNFKASLAVETKNKQSEFERVLYELQQQQQGTAEDVAQLESKLKDKLDSIDEALARGDVLLNWPVDPSRGITATFHDPTYPFRNLFEHPGTDVRASVGTPVKSAAGGYVAWNKKGRMYGNYTMVVHPGNIATVYAHLSKFTAKPDTYVERGDQIGLSGGRPGDPGAGLSTGPHLHFEVRKNGIPVNPESYLPDVNPD
jgi:murein DD-endopeptidase MepM/ murein hydrolase activator NlpD